MIEKQNYIDLNVAIVPDVHVSLKLIQWSKFISSQFKTHYVLDITNRLPHLSLYSARYPIKNRQLVEETVSNIVNTVDSFKVILKGFSFFSGYFFYDAEKSSPLVQLHEKIVDKLNPLREGLISDIQKQLRGLSSDQKGAIEEYGFVSVKKLYMPHLSITHLVNPSEGSLAVKVLPQETNSFSVTTLAISNFAEYGTFPQPFETYSIKYGL